jgi:lysozyme family protein
MLVWVFVIFFVDGKAGFHPSYMPIPQESMEVCLSKLPNAKNFFDEMGKQMDIPPFVVGCAEAEDIQSLLEYAKTLKPGEDV